MAKGHNSVSKLWVDDDYVARGHPLPVEAINPEGEVRTDNEVPVKSPALEEILLAILAELRLANLQRREMADSDMTLQDIDTGA